MANFRQKSVEDWQAPYETNVGKLAKAHPIANVIGLGIPALVQSAAGGVGNAASIMATPDTRPAARRIEDAVQGSNFVTGIKQVTTPGPDKMQVPVSPIIPAAQAATKALVPSIESTPMLPSHTPDTGAPVPTADQATQNAWKQAQKNRWPLTNAASNVPSIDQNPTGDQGQGFAMVDGKRIDYRDIGTSADPLKGRGQVMTVSAGQGGQAVNDSSGTAPPIGGDKWSFLEDGTAFGTAKAGVARKLGYVPVDYDRNPGKYDALIAAQGAQYDRNAQEIPVAQIGLEGHKYVADQDLAGHQALAGATVKSAEIGADARANENKAAAQLKLSEKNDKETAEGQKFLSERGDYWRKYLVDNPQVMESALANYAKTIGKDPKDLTPDDQLNAQNNLIRAKVMDDLRQRGTGNRESQIAVVAGKLKQAEAMLKAQAANMQPGRNLPGQEDLTNQVITLRKQLKDLQGAAA